MTVDDRAAGCLLGTALGDSLLLPAEGLSRQRVARRFAGPLRQRLVAGRGMVSDDSEHAFLTAQALLEAEDDPQLFARALARRLRWWLACVPAGCGMATARALLKSWIGFPPRRSGVFSAGNGPSMRAAIIGVRWRHDPAQRMAFVSASTRITHSDPRADIAAQAVAAAAAHAGDETAVWAAWHDLAADAEWRRLVDLLRTSRTAGEDVDAVARRLGCPDYVAGYSYTSVPLALYAWLAHGDDLDACLSALLRCGGDTDTMGAIAGALWGAQHGAAALPRRHLDAIADWPLSTVRLRAAGAALCVHGGEPIGWGWPLLPLRNAVFFAIVLAHGLRRLWT